MAEVEKERWKLSGVFNTFLAILKRIGLDGFILGLIGMIFLAYLWPGGGVSNGTFSLAQVANIGVSLIFFFYGLRLDPEKLKAGLRNWKLHWVIHIATFVIFPIIIILCRYLLPAKTDDYFWLGVFYLAALPSTVSSSVVMVSIAKGNMPAAIFNASISSLIGVFITPLWMGLYMNTAGGSMELWSVIGKLIIQVLLPVVLGMVLHHRFGVFAEQHRKGLRQFDQSVILLIVYTSFCESFDKHMFDGFGVLRILGVGASMIVLFFLVFMLITSISRLLHFSREDRITAVFCGSKKSLVHGTVMSKVLFPGSHMVGIILLPVMMYHALQLVAASIIAQKMAKHTDE